MLVWLIFARSIIAEVGPLLRTLKRKLNHLSFAPDVLRIEKASFQDFGADGQAFVEAQAKRPDLYVDNLEYLVERLGSEIEVGAQGNAVLPVRRLGKTLVGVSIQGVTPNITTLSNLEIAYGRTLTATDDEFRRRVCIIGQDLVDELFPTTGPIGNEIQLGQPAEGEGVVDVGVEGCGRWCWCACL